MGKGTPLLTLDFEMDLKKLERHVFAIAESVEESLSRIAPRIREIVVRNVLDNSNWNPEAVYSEKSPLSGQRYDLALSGQLRMTIGSPQYNTIEHLPGKGFEVGIGNIPVLDSLRSQRDEYGSPFPSARSANAPYWRFVVFGHGPPKKNFTFVRTGAGPLGKDTGIITLGKRKMKGTPPTYMFKNGLMVSGQEIENLVDKAIAEGLKGVSKRW